MSNFRGKAGAKYGNTKTVFDGIKFDSRAEAKRYQELSLLQAAGEISNLELQPVFELQSRFKHGKRTISAIKFVADFTYIEKGQTVVEDVKGYRTDVFRMKEKMFLHRYPDIDFRTINVK